MDAFNLTARLRLDTSEYDEALGRVRENLPRLGDESEETGQRGEQAAHRMGAAFKTVAVAVGAAVSAAAAGAGALVKQSVDAYANYEQLVGGVETLFSNLEGTVSAAPKVLENASNAYKTAGMSANDYMETVTSFSAALVSSLGNDYQKAAEISDMAIRDMSDNANKMGTSMDAIQNAYQGFSKQNYTMLDNLKLGYGGTKTEMERLIKDAEKMNSAFKAQRDENGDLAMSLDDVYNAIHIVQVEMGIAGTTAKEAGETISGSFGSLSAAWENLVTGFADKSADIPSLINDVVQAAEGSFNNLLPVVQQAINGIATFVEDVAPVIVDKLPGLVDEIVPPLLSTAQTVVSSLVSSLPTMLDAVIDVVPSVITGITGTIIDNLPKIAGLGVELVTSLADGITNAIPELIPATITAIDGIAKELTNPDTLMKITHSGLELIKSLATGIADNLPQLADTAWEIVSNLADYLLDPDRIVEMVTAGGEIVTNLVGGILSAVPKMIEGAAELVGKFVEGLFTTDWIDVGVRICTGIWDGIVSAAGKIVDAGRKLGEDLYKALNPEKGIDAIDSYNAAIETMAASVDDVRNSWHDLNQEQKDLKLEELGKQVEEASKAMAESIKSVSDGYFSFYTDTLGDAENAIMQFAEKYEGTLTTLDSMGFSLNFTGKETADEVLNVLDELIQAMKDTGDENVTTSRAFYSLVQASDKLKNAKNNVDELNNAFNELAQDSYENIKILTANYGSFLRIPTEAARQMAGIAAVPIKAFGEEMNDSLKETGAAIENGLKTTSKAVNDFVDLGFGNYKNLGIVQVLGHTFTEAENLINDKARSVYQYHTQIVERQVALGKMTLEEQISAYKTIQGQFVEGSEQYLDAEQKVYSLQKQLNKEREDSEKESLEKRKQAWEDYAQKVQGINDQIADIQAKYDEAVKSRANDIANSYRLFDEVPKRVAMSGKTLISNLEGQVDRMKLFYDDLGKLAGKGVSEGLVQAIRDMGPAALDELEAILDMDEADLAKYNKTFEMKVDLSTSVAEKELEPMKQETESKISEMYGEIGALTAENALSIGTSFMTGIGTAIADNADTVAEQAKDAVSKSWQEAFGTSDTSSVGTIAPELTSNMTVNNENHFNFTLNGIQYQNITSLAKAISNELQFLTNRRAAGYAGT